MVSQPLERLVVSGGGAEQLIFGASSAGLSAGQVAQIGFVNPAGFPAGTYAAVILGTGEVVPLAVRPQITLQPTNRTAVAGDTVQFTAAATGTPAWRAAAMAASALC